MTSDAPAQTAPPPPAPAAAGGPPPPIDPSRPTFQRLDRCAPSPYTRKEYVARFLWSCVQATLFRLSPPRAYGWRRALLRRFGARIGAHVRPHARCRVVHPWLLEVGDWSSLGDHTVVYNLGPVRIGSHTGISQGVYLCAGTHDYTRPDLPLLRSPVTVGSGVWIAAQAFICPGVTVGDNSVIGARSVVTADVPPGVVAAGNPARVLKARPLSDGPAQDVSQAPRSE